MKIHFHLPTSTRFHRHYPVFKRVLSCCVALVASIVPMSGQSNLTAYEYWFDDHFDNRTVVAISPTTTFDLITTLGVTDLSLGLHAYHIRFKDDSSRFSSVISQAFISGGNQNLIDRFQYWFDDHYSLATTVNIAPQAQYNMISTIDAVALSRGMHRIHFRYREVGGVWSSITSAFFLKSGEGLSPINLMDAYTYWLDDAVESATLVTLDAPTNPLDLITNIDMTGVPHGNHVIHFQFKDLSGLWSSVVSDTIMKNPLPIASFSSPNSVVCLGEYVEFVNESFDADSMLWDFGDGTLSSELNPTHLYALPGVYDVSLTATDSVSGIDSTFFAAGFITVLGDVNADFTTDVNDGTVSFTNNCMYASDYLWNFGDGNTSDEFEPLHTYTADGTYIVTLVASNACGDATVSSEVIIVGAGILDLSTIGEINIYPNPFHDNLQISIKREGTTSLDIRLYDTNGKEISIITHQPAVPSEYIFNWSSGSLPAGMYILKIKSANTEVFYRIVKI
jgi:hypothetical protein